MNIFMIVLSGVAALVTGAAWIAGGGPKFAFYCGANLMCFVVNLRDALEDR